MTLPLMSSASGLLARKGSAAPLGLRRPQQSGDDQPETEAPAPEAVPVPHETEARAAEGSEPVQLDLGPDLGPDLAAAETAKASEEPPPPASLLPFSLRRERRESGETWELVSSEIFERMAGLAKEARPAERPESAKDEQAKDEPVKDTVSEVKTPEPEPTPDPESAPQGAAETDTLPASPRGEAPPTETAEAAEVAPATTDRADSEARDTAPETEPEPGPEPEPQPAAGEADTARNPEPAEAAPARAAETAGDERGGDETAERETALAALGARAAQAGASAEAIEPDQAKPRVAAAPIADPVWRMEGGRLSTAERAGSGRWLLLGAAACLAIVGIAWWSYSTQSPKPEAPQSAPGAEASPVSPAPAAEQQAAAPAEPDPQAGPGAATAPPAAEIVPSVDLVRIEPDGDAVIAGRAAPNSELIVLDNGLPIGTVTADQFGEWVFVPDQPLSEGRHEFGLVLKSVQGTVAVPAGKGKDGEAAADDGTGEAPAQAAPKPGDGAGAKPLPPRKPESVPGQTEAGQTEAGGLELRVPIPLRKPANARDRAGDSQTGQSDPGAAPAREGGLGLGLSDSDFVVQLASVKTRDGARQEWAKLQSRFPEALGGMNLNLDEAKLLQQGNVVRVRTGPFPDLNEAVDFCQRMREGQQDCLVVRTSAANLTLLESRTQ